MVLLLIQAESSDPWCVTGCTFVSYTYNANRLTLLSHIEASLNVATGEAVQHRDLHREEQQHLQTAYTASC